MRLGLVKDYQVFLVSRVREAYAHGSGPPRRWSLDSGTASGWWWLPR